MVDLLSSRNLPENRGLFESAPIAMWEVDALRLQAWLDDLRSQGVADLRSLLESDPRQILHGLSLLSVRRVNSAAITLFGARDESHLLKKSPWVLASVPLPVLIDVFVARWRDQPSFYTESSMSTLEGRQLHELIGISLPEEAGRLDLSRSLVVFTDITDRNRTETALRESEERLRLAMQASGTGWWDWDLRTNTLTLDDQCKALLDLPRTTEITPDEILQRLRPGDRRRVDEVLAAAFAQPGDYSAECSIQWADGSVHWGLLCGHSFQGPAGTPKRLMGVAVDITAKKRAEEALHESEEFHHTLLDTLPVGVVLADPEGKITYISPQARRTFDIPPGQGLGTNPLDWIAPEHHEVVWQRMRRVLVDRQSLSAMEYRMFKLDGTPVWAELASAPYFGVEGRLKGVITICQDVTARKLAEEDLRVAKAAAEDASRAKSQFLANMSHELRTPLNSILGMTELVLQEELSPFVRDCLQTAKDSSDSLLGLINEILDLSRIEAGMFPLEPHPFRLRALLDETLRAIGVRAFEKHLELACDVAANVPDWLVGDALRLRQILTNLLGNAIKFTEQGEVIVRVEREADDGEEVYLRFAVADTGIGIATEHQQRVFSPFAQADASTTRRYGGTGLGLSIVSQLVNLLGGRIWLESQLGQGSTFFFTASLRHQPAPQPQDAEQLVLEQLRDRPVLVAESHATTRRILEDLLSSWSMRPAVALDFPDALAQLREAAVHERQLPLLILDAMLPGLTGQPWREQLQADPSTNAVLVLMSSPVNEQRLSRPSDAEDAVVHLEKPISPLAVLRALAQAMGGTLSPEKTLQETASLEIQPAARPLRILLAEDTPGNQKLAVHILSKRGHAVEVAENGQEAIQRFRENDFDAVLMDVQMPLVDGFQATEVIRQMHPSHKARVPIIAMTAHALKGDRERCLAAGMDAYISKPIRAPEMISLVERLARGGHRTEATSRQPTPAEENTGCPLTIEGRSPAGVPPTSTLPPFNLVEAVAQCFGKYDIFQDMVACFFDEAQPLIEKMLAAVTLGDREAIYQAAHRLKNTVVYLGASRATKATQQVEQASKSQDSSSVREAIEALEEETDRLKQALEPYRKEDAG
jgi:PAS domain S-box-containing protein